MVVMEYMTGYQTPISINPEIPRHPDAMGLRSIRKEHDVFMFEEMFSGLEV